MARYKRFTFLCNIYERRLIEALAKRLERNQSDAIRFVVKAAAKELGVSDQFNSSMNVTVERDNDNQ